MSAPIWQPLTQYSEFARLCLERWPDACQTLVDEQRLTTTGIAQPDALNSSFDLDLEAFDRALRCYRQTECLRITWREFTGNATVEQSLFDLSILAENCIQHALDWHQNNLQQRFGMPILNDGSKAGLCIIGMGKLGGQELNFSSDIDIVFIHNGKDKTSIDTHSQRRITQEQFFTRLAQQLCASLDNTSQYGQVYRVDTRLRPFGNSGRLIWTMGAMEQYFLTQGRDWERYAWQKARPVAGDIALGESLLKQLQPFIYRRYLDYGLFAGVRKIRADIAREAALRNSGDNLKLGPGGIREIEFLVQSLQLLRGGPQPLLRQRNLLRALQALKQHEQLNEADYTQLYSAYVYLRKLENRLQMQADQQAHTLPKTPLEQTQYAHFCDYPDITNTATDDSSIPWPAFIQKLDHHRQHVLALFEHWFAESTLQTNDQETDFHQLPESIDKTALIKQADNIEARLRKAGLGNTSLQRWHDLLALLSHDVKEKPKLADALPKVLDLLASIAARSNYLALLIEHPQARQRMLKLCVSSDYLSQQLQQHPVLLDDLIDPLVLKDLATNQAEIQARLHDAQPANDDLETWLYRTKQWQQSYQFRLAINLLFKQIDPIEVQQQLSWLAEAIIIDVLQQCRNQYPELADVDFVIVAYGTLGAKEMHFWSDLDLTFLYQPNPKNLQQSEYQAARLSQKLIHWLCLPLPHTPLYAIDTRLRPNGSSGTLVSNIDAFENYQTEKAWTWELQALSRARPIAGSEKLSQQFDMIRTKILQPAQQTHKIAADMFDIWQRMDGLNAQQKLRLQVLYICQYAFLCQPLTDTLPTNLLQQIEYLHNQNKNWLEPAKVLSDCWNAIQQNQFQQQLSGTTHMSINAIENKLGIFWNQLIESSG